MRLHKENVHQFVNFVTKWSKSTLTDINEMTLSRLLTSWYCSWALRRRCLRSLESASNFSHLKKITTGFMSNITTDVRHLPQVAICVDSGKQHSNSIYNTIPY